jgi:hypothetical protein
MSEYRRDPEKLRSHLVSPRLPGRVIRQAASLPAVPGMNMLWLDFAETESIVGAVN